MRISAHVRFADSFVQRLKDDVDAYLLQVGITHPPLEDDPADIPDPQAKCASSLRQLSFREALDFRGSIVANQASFMALVRTKVF